MLESMKTFNEIMTGPHPLTQEEIRKLIAKRPAKYSYMKAWLKERDKKSRRTMQRRDKKPDHVPSYSKDRSYELRERDIFHADLRRIEKAPLADRKEGTVNFADAMAHNPVLVAERVGWLLDGSYGKGAYDAAHEVIRTPRMNRVSWLGSAIGALEWRSPQRATAAAWHKLSAAQKAALHKAIEREIQDALKAPPARYGKVE